MIKDFKSNTYICDDHVIDTIYWLMYHQDSYDRFEFDAFSQKITVHHANGTDEIKPGQYLNASYGILITS